MDSIEKTNIGKTHLTLLVGDPRESENFHMIFHMLDLICEYFDSEARETLLECVFVNPDQKTNNLIF